MYESSDPSIYLQQMSGAGGYSSLPHSLPEYTFEETPLCLTTGRRGRGGGYGPGAAGAAGSAQQQLLYSPIFSTNHAGSGPASSRSPFHFHTSSATTDAALLSSIPAASTRFTSSPSHFTVENMDVNPDLAAQEAAAREYQPILQGALVGEKMSSTAITEEYAKADPIYVQKTIMLPQTYSHYRQVQGDGNCGWRAVAFGYFELLIKAGRKEQLVSEKVRLESLNGLIEATTGLSPYVFENFVEETTALLARMSEIMHNPQQAMAELYQAFNNPEVSNSVMYHFRLLASAYLKGNTETYAAFVTDERGVDGYCSSTLERHHVEIDHLGLTLLVNVLLKPINFVLEVAYLDRSAGAEVNTYRFPEELNGEDPRTLGPMIHLLYRPDHYDILYPTESVPESTAVQVHRVGFSQSYEVAAAPVGLHNFGVVNLNPLSLIPGFGTTASILDTTPSPLSAYNLSPASQWMASRYAADSPQPVAPMTAVTPAAPVMVPMPEICPVRFSEYCKLPEYIENDTWREPSFQTIMFKNSHFNVAHYNNPNFQPEEYVPDLEEYDAPPRIRKKRASV